MNWDKQDLAKKLLKSSSSMRSVYSRQPSNSDTARTHREQVISRLSSQLDTKISHLPKKQQKLRIETFIEETAPKIIGQQSAVTHEEAEAQVQNHYQKLHYLYNKSQKWAKTSTISHETSPSFKDHNKRESYTGNAQSKIIWSEADKKPSRINHQKQRFDILTHQENRQRFEDIGADDKGVPKQTYKLVNGISEFQQTTQKAQSNLNKDYQAEYAKNKNCFKRVKGMCSEIAALATTNAYISPTFGRR